MILEKDMNESFQSLKVEVIKCYEIDLNKLRFFRQFIMALNGFSLAGSG